MRYFRARSQDVANGPGIRTSIWLCGCDRHCPGCFNQEIADFNAGKPLSFQMMKKFASIGGTDKEVVGFSILGGEPLQQDKEEMLKLLKCMKAYPKKTIWMWTGYTYEELTQDQLDIVKHVHVLVDGPFIKELSKPLKFRGSSNQRIIDVRKTIKTGEVIINSLFN